MDGSDVSDLGFSLFQVAVRDGLKIIVSETINLMRYFILLSLAAILGLSSVTASAAGTSRHSSGAKQWALFSGKHVKKAKKERKSKRNKNKSKRQHRAKSSR
jgi:hypothetical protein